MKIKNLLFFLFLAFVSCQSDAPSSDTTQDNAQEETDQQDQSPPSEGERYLKLQGNIGDYPITMNLQINPTATNQGWDYSGTYYYDNIGQPLSVQGTTKKGGIIELEEYDQPGNVSGKFVGKINGQNEFSGSWRSGDNKRELDFLLKPPLKMIFQMLAFSDSLEWKAEGTEGATAYYDETWLWPADYVQADHRNFLRQQILIQMAGDSMAALHKDPKTLYAIQKDQFFEDFAAEMQLVLDNNDGEDPSWLPPGYAISTSMEITYDSPELLTIAYLNYSYLGGAHGNYGTTFKVYDLAQQKVLTLDDIFQPDYKTKLNLALSKAMRKAYDIEESQDLTEVLFENTIEANDNFGLTSQGILFNYVPYEISAYAVGEIRLFVPFEELKEVLKPDFVK